MSDTPTTTEPTTGTPVSPPSTTPATTTQAPAPTTVAAAPPAEIKPAWGKVSTTTAEPIDAPTKSWPSLGDAAKMEKTRSTPSQPTPAVATTSSAPTPKEKESTTTKGGKGKWTSHSDQVPTATSSGSSGAPTATTSASTPSSTPVQASSSSSTTATATATSTASVPTSTSNGSQSNTNQQQQQSGAQSHSDSRGDSSRRGGGSTSRRGGRGGSNMGGRGGHHHTGGPTSSTTSSYQPRRGGPPASGGQQDRNESGFSSGGNPNSYYQQQYEQYPYEFYNSYMYDHMVAVRQQTEYYFSDENLNRDVYLRSHLDAEGYIPVEVIANFRRLANMINGFPHPDNLNFLLMSLQDSSIVEIDSMGHRLRQRVRQGHLSVNAPAFVPMAHNNVENTGAPTASGASGASGSSTTTTATAAAAPTAETKADSKSTAAEIVAAAAAMSIAPAVTLSANSPSSLRRSPGTARRSPATGRSPRSPGIFMPQGSKDGAEGDWTAVGKKPKAKSASKDQRKQNDEAADDEMFMFDEDTASRPGAKNPFKHSSTVEDSEDEEEVGDEELDNVVVIVQTPDPRAKKFEPRDRTGIANLKAKSEFAGHILDELKDYNDGVDHRPRSGSYSKTSLVSQAEFEAQRVASGTSPSMLLQQSAPRLPGAALGSSPLSGISPSRGIATPKSPVVPSGTIGSDGKKKFFPTPNKNPPAPSNKPHYKSKYGSNPVTESGVGWFQVRQSRASPAPTSMASSLDPSNSTPNARQLATDLISPSSGNIIEQKYRKFVNECLEDRRKNGPGKSELMSALYRFWSFFLRNSFNRSVYEEFKDLARSDNVAGFSYGMECLYRFYSYGLEKYFRRGPFEDFTKYVLEDFKNGNLYGLEKLWAFMKYRKDKRPVQFSSELEQIMTQFKTLEDFHSYGSRASNTGAGATAGSKQ